MYVVGLTGVIGSGKSTVGAELEALGVPLYNCDFYAKELIKSSLRSQIIEIFGLQAYTEDGLINRPYMAEKIFADQQLRRRLEAIVHPSVAADFGRWLTKHHGVPYVVVESAILIGNPIEQMVDHIVVVSAPMDLIIERVMRRDGVSRERVEERLSAQMDSGEMIQLAQSVIYSSDDELLTPKVIALHEKLLTLQRN